MTASRLGAHGTRRSSLSATKLMILFLLVLAERGSNGGRIGDRHRAGIGAGAATATPAREDAGISIGVRRKGHDCAARIARRARRPAVDPRRRASDLAIADSLVDDRQ